MGGGEEGEGGGDKGEEEGGIRGGWSEAASQPVLSSMYKQGLAMEGEF